MTMGIVGKKLGMTQVYTEDGSLVGVTVIEAGPCPVLRVNARSIQLGFDAVDEKRVKKPVAGYYKKRNIATRKVMKEVSNDASKEYKVGDEIKVDVFQNGEFVDVTGTSLGKGFQGGMKRHHWNGGPASHGSTSHRRVGSIGSSTTPGRVWRGHNMPGHMGQETVTVQNLKVIKVDLENNLLLVEGAVPGHKNAYLLIKKAVKKQAKLAKAAAKATK
ncbi:MAG TPA: 50S ribosomal protein L3 [Candidatus Omnitrophota bacterium]|nr:50S ribosomal protein L3 [Candidatus Omnitrophota bacterium]HPT07527.1 50S ribosomal protein L3 [Candidatus Omnitrophota bacterium]